jgi:hypothetical protein
LSYCFAADESFKVIVEAKIILEKRKTRIANYASEMCEKKKTV